MEQHVNLNNVMKFGNHFTKMKRTVLILLFVLVGLTATNIAKAQTIIDEGTCGANLTWQLTSNGVLTISGSGAMDNYHPNIYPVNTAPWDPYKEEIKTIIIGDGATTIGWYAFSGCSNLTSITIPDSITQIGGYAFNECSGLTSVTIPDAVTEIEGSTFANCSNLELAIIGNSVRWIEAGAFANCVKLASVTIGESVYLIIENAFERCTGLRTIICKAITPPTLEEDVGLGWGLYITLIIIPCNTLSAYMSSDWGNISDNFEEDCSGLNDMAQNENITIYPNPAKDKFFVGFEGFMAIKLYDVLGKEVLNQNATGTAEIDVKNLPAGMYFVRIQTDKGVMVKKVVKR